MASRTGTASQVDASAASGSTSVTVPANATCAVAFWAAFNNLGPSTLSTLTLGGNAFTTRSEIATKVPVADRTGTGVATLTNLPGTGTQTLAWAWSDADARDEGGGLVVVWVKDVNIAVLVRDSDVQNASTSTIPSVTIDSIATDLVMAMAQRFGDPDPIINAPTVFVNNMNVNSEGYDVGEYVGGPSSTTCTLAAPDYSTIAAISLASLVTVTTNPYPVRTSRETSW
jgi:hypothetical protein